MLKMQKICVGRGHIILNDIIKKKRGRPIGFKLSDESRKAISESKMGQRHSIETRDKISKSLRLYFRQLHPLSSEMSNQYMYSKETVVWLKKVKKALDAIDEVKTERSLKNINKTELPFGEYIELFSHNFTPETILLFKEECLENGISYSDINEVCSG